MKTVKTEDLKRRLDAGPIALFDVRGDVEYEMGHIPGAKTAPLGSLIFRVADVVRKGTFVVVYADGIESPLAVQAAERLENLGLTNVHCYRAGLQGWQEAGLKLVESANPRLQARGPVREGRPVVIDRNTAYGGVFRTVSNEVEGAGG